jgi:hypothetical protein
MAQEPNQKPSILAKFPISFEYNITWQEAKKAVRIRTATN